MLGEGDSGNTEQSLAHCHLANPTGQALCRRLLRLQSMLAGGPLVLSLEGEAGFGERAPLRG